MSNVFIQHKPGALSLIEPSRPFIEKILTYDFETIIDFGCGFGCHVAEFARAEKIATGVDVHFLPEAREEARTGGYVLIEGSWEQLEDESFDVGFSHHCLEHAQDPISWLNAWGKKIKPGGSFLCQFQPIGRPY